MRERYHGAWSHFMDGSTGKTMPVFGMFDNGGDLVETSFLMEGLLAARQYFRGNSAAERDLYRRISELWETVEWDWYRGPETGRFSLLALVGGVGMADSTSAYRLQRSHDHLFVGDVIADPWSSSGICIIPDGRASRSVRCTIGQDGPAAWTGIITPTATAITESSWT